MNRPNRLKAAMIAGLCIAAAVVLVVRNRAVAKASARHRARAVAKAKRTAPSKALPVPSSQHRSTPEERESRASAIRETIEVIRAECQRNAGGDWNKWSEQLRDVRAELISKANAAKPYNSTAEGYFEARGAVLEGRDNFPLVESKPDNYLIHIVEPASLDKFRKEHPVVDAARWLQRQGIDVIFVPVPKMTEVYPEYFTDHCPTDRIIAPHVRQAMLELLEADIEVVDLWYAFQEARYAHRELLYLPADPHWNPWGQAIAARMVAARMKRYDFVARAQASPPMCETAQVPYLPASEGAAYQALNPEQRKRAEVIQPRTYLASTNLKYPQFNETGPVACIGDSYNGGFMEFLGRELNLPLRNLSAGGNTSDAFKNFLRNPELLKDCKVVVWLVCNSSLKNPWPLPPSIRETSEPRAGE